MNDNERLGLERRYQQNRLEEEAFYMRKRMEREYEGYSKRLRSRQENSLATDLIILGIVTGALIYCATVLL